MNWHILQFVREKCKFTKYIWMEFHQNSITGQNILNPYHIFAQEFIIKIKKPWYFVVLWFNHHLLIGVSWFSYQWSPNCQWRNHDGLRKIHPKPTHKSQNASGKYPTMQHFVNETFLSQTCALWIIGLVRCGIYATGLAKPQGNSTNCGPCS